MSVYMIIDSKVKDREKYRQYIDQVSPIVTKYGGCYRVRGGEVRSFGTWKPERIILIEFPTEDHIQRWLSSPEYTAMTDLTVEGTADWIFWEETHATPTGLFDHKSAGADTNSISDLSVYGAVGPYYDSLGNPSQSFSWTDGTPNNPSATDMQNSFANGPVGNGLQFTVAADTRTKYLKVYSGGFDGIITCQATLSDNSAPPISLTLDDTGDYNHYDYFTIQFAANSTNKHIGRY